MNLPKTVLVATIACAYAAQWVFHFGAVQAVESERVKINQEEVVLSIRSGLRVLVRGAENYPSHADCFSCHHQTLPLLALMLSKDSPLLNIDQVLDFESTKLAQNVTKFTKDSFLPMEEDLLKGKEVDGKTLTVGYGLWTLHLARATRDNISDALVKNLVQTQREDGHWDFHTIRPPASSSESMTTALALFGLKQFGTRYIGGMGPTEYLDARIPDVLRKAKSWMKSMPRSNTNEDLVGHVWCAYLLLEPGDNPETSQGLREMIWKHQMEDGGWAQEPGMSSDAYATGQSLIFLSEVNADYKRSESIYRDERYRKAIRFLLDRQKPDGSWHVVSRAKPVQEYFDNGDPHGKDQFISMLATGWATASLAAYLNRTPKPLGQSADRVGAAKK